MDRISHYKIVRRIGAGGMGEVWRAVDDRLGRDVAIKVLGRRATPERAQRMLREAQAASALNHPGIVTIHDVGDHEGSPYLVMELVDGVRFSDLGRVEPAEALRLCALAADALGAAHARGILHRDIKSDNLMRLADGRVKVLDFGLAKVGADLTVSTEVVRNQAPIVSPTAETQDSSERTPIPPPEDRAFATTVDSSTRRHVAPRPASSPSDLTRAGDIMGTPAYMSPEQARGESADARSEVFSLGVVLYELLAGRRPFLADDVEAMLVQVRRARFAPVSEVTGDPALARYDAVVAQCLAADPNARPPDMHAMAKLLRRDADRPRRRRTWPIAAGAGVLAAGVAGAIGFASHRAPPERPAAPAPSVPVIGEDVARLTLESGCDEFPTISPDGRRVIYDTTRGPDDNLEEVETGKQHRALTSGSVWDIAPALSPDGKQLAFLRKQDGPYRLVVDDSELAGTPRQITIGAMRPRWTPDGKSLWGGDGRHPARWNVATGATERSLTLPSGLQLLTVLELADGTVVGLVFKPETDGFPFGVAMFDRQDHFRLLYQGELDEVLWPAPDGRGVIVSMITAARRELAIIPLSGAPPILMHAAGVNASKGLVMTTDGSVVVWSDCVERIDVATVRHAGAETTYTPLTSDAWADAEPVVPPGTRQVIVVSDRSGETRPWVIDRDSAIPARMIADVDVTRLDVTRDGKTLVYSNDNGELWRIATDGTGAPEKLAAHENLRAPMVGPDGNVYFDADGQIFKVPLAGGSPAPWRDGAAAAPSPTGKLVVYARGNQPGERTLLVHDLATGAEYPVAADLPTGDWSRVRFSEDGARLTAMRGQGEVFVIDVAAGKIVDRVVGTSRTFLGSALAGPHGEDLLVSENWWRGNLWRARRRDH